MDVSFETCKKRNKNRNRSVPERVIKEYVQNLEKAISSLKKEQGLIDEWIECNNDKDDNKTGKLRWGDQYDVEWNKNLRRSVSLAWDEDDNPDDL